jgi:hypothetical protein
MRPLAKVGLVGAGYIGALAVAAAVVMIHVAATNTPDRMASSGMSAFGDSLLFLAVFGVAAMVPTGAALFFLRPYRAVWSVLAAGGLAVAATAVAALLDYLASQAPRAEPVMSPWSILAILRILGAPLAALTFLVAAVLAPSRGPRLALLVAVAIEAGVFMCVALIWARAFLSS